MRQILPINPKSGLVKIGILGEDWTPVLSLELIIFALQNMLKFPLDKTFSDSQ